MPQDVTPQQLDTLLNGLLGQGGDGQPERLPYSFFIDKSELGGELGTHLVKNAVRGQESSCWAGETGD